MKKLLIGLGVSFLLSTGAAVAGDVAAGKAAANNCAMCHGEAGISPMGMFPNLAGQKKEYLEKQLKAFRDGSRVDPSMNPTAKGLSDEDIANVSAYYSSL